MAETKSKSSTNSDIKRVDKVYLVRFRQNRSFELYVNRKVYFFGPHEEKRLKESVVKHQDFIQVEKLFSVQEVK